MEMVSKITKIDYEKLLKNGYEIFIFDFDNTINKWRESLIPDEVKKIFDYLLNKNVKVIIVSNGKPRKINYDNVNVVWLAKKPLIFKFKKFLKRNNLLNKKIVVIGDQLFTDMLFGKLLGAYLIKVEPIDTSKEFFITKILRFLEKIVLKFL